MRIDIFHHDDTATGRRLSDIERALDRLTFRLERHMAKLDEDLDKILASVTSEDTKLDSLIALTTELKRRVDEIVAGTVTPEQQAKLDAIFAAVADNPDRVQAAIDANT